MICPLLWARIEAKGGMMYGPISSVCGGESDESTGSYLEDHWREAQVVRGG
jgi:hypothetical protein